jgi:hypothetical protein
MKKTRKKKGYVFTAARKRALKKAQAAARRKNVKGGKNKRGKG